MELDLKGPKISFEIPFIEGAVVTETTIIQWIVMLFIMVVILILTHNMQRIPTKRQVVAEAIVKSVNNLVEVNMGKKMKGFAPYIAALFAMILFGSLVSLVGLRSTTADINIPITFALMTFILITFFKFKNNGFLGYFAEFGKPVVFIFPINVLSEIATPVSMSLRLFGNMFGGMVITGLIYAALTAAAGALGSSIPFLSVGIPAILSIYFDIFVGFIQSFVFVMLTLVYVGQAANTETN